MRKVGTKINNGFPFIVILLIIVVIVGVVGYLLHRGALRTSITESTAIPSSQQQTTPGLKAFQSSALEFVVELPTRYKVEEGAGRIKIFEDGKANIYIDRTATDWESLTEYFEDLKHRNSPKILHENTLSIDDSDAQVVDYDYPESPESVQREYNIYVEGWIYSIYTDSKILIQDLDRIAKSFKYIPD